jgi:hypothetical protein
MSPSSISEAEANYFLRDEMEEGGGHVIAPFFV